MVVVPHTGIANTAKVGSYRVRLREVAVVVDDAAGDVDAASEQLVGEVACGRRTWGPRADACSRTVACNVARTLAAQVLADATR